MVDRNRKPAIVCRPGQRRSSMCCVVDSQASGEIDFRMSWRSPLASLAFPGLPGLLQTLENHLQADDTRKRWDSHESCKPFQRGSGICWVCIAMLLVVGGSEQVCCVQIIKCMVWIWKPVFLGWFSPQSGLSPGSLVDWTDFSDLNFYGTHVESQ